MTLPNQIGLDGDVTPTAYMAEIEARMKVAMEPKVLFDRFGIKVERRWSWKFSHPEYHITLRYPNRRKPQFCMNYDDVALARKALLLVFGSVPQLRGGWHARGGPVLVDIIPPKLNTEVIGYKNPINLANYK